MAITLSVGTRLPAAYTSMGRVLLAQLPQSELETYINRIQLERHTLSSITEKNVLREEIDKARNLGYAVVDQELDLGLRSVAVPAYSASGELLGALNISTNAARVDMDTLLNMYLPRLQIVADQIRQAAR
jgi:IclR family pca regulon transcriptional regulator